MQVQSPSSATTAAVGAAVVFVLAAVRRRRQAHDAEAAAAARDKPQRSFAGPAIDNWTAGRRLLWGCTAADDDRACAAIMTHSGAGTRAFKLLPGDDPSAATTTAAGAAAAAPAASMDGDRAGAAVDTRDLSTVHWVDTEESLAAAAAEIQRHCVVGVDLEAHAQRSFQGFTCLMQLSVRGHDFVVDTMRLRHRIRHHLSGIFADPEIVKVLHGCAHDVVWLQRDFSMRCVGVFDTSEAARALGTPNVSLVVLLRDYCNVHETVAEKHAYQLADWRQRPLTPAMLEYARSDSHFLPHLRAALLSALTALPDGAERLEDVAQRCRTLALRTYTCTEPPTPATHVREWGRVARSRGTRSVDLPPAMREMARREVPEAERVRLRSRAVFASLFSWRDTVARREDESLRYVCASDILFDIAITAARYPRVFQAVARAPDGTGASQAVALIEACTGMGRKLLQAMVVEHALEVVRAACNDAAVEMSASIIAASEEASSGAAAGAGSADAGDGDGGADVDGGGGGGGRGGGASSSGAGPDEAHPARGPDWSAEMREDVAAASTDPRAAAKAKRYKAFVERFSCKKAVYQSCRLLRPDGTLLTYCDQNKVDWYVVKGIGELVELDGEEPGRTCRLLFEPNTATGVGEVPDMERDAQGYYDSTKRNCCVRCGQEQYYLRYHVVPRLYRTHFPDAFKSHRAHDVVLLCVECHNMASTSEAPVVQMLAEKYGAPLDGSDDAGMVAMRERAQRVRHARSSATALSTQAHKMPKHRLEALQAAVRRFADANKDAVDHALALLHKARAEADAAAKAAAAAGGADGSGGVTPIKASDRRRRSGRDATPYRLKLAPAVVDALTLETDLVLAVAALPTPEVSAAGREAHGRRVVAKVVANGELNSFIRDWRKHFLTHKPRYLPPDWSVDHAVVRTFGEESKFYHEGQQNIAADGSTERVSRFRGVYWDHALQAWRAKLRIHGRWVLVKNPNVARTGSDGNSDGDGGGDGDDDRQYAFDSDEAAARMYDGYARARFHQAAVCNFPLPS